MQDIRCAISVPIYGEYSNPALMVELACEAEIAGWDAFFLWDAILFMEGFNRPIGDPWIMLAAIASRTKRIRLGPMVTPVARRRPWKLARETATLDNLSEGRLILGVGLGYPQDAEFEHFGEEGDAKIRAGKLDEGLEILVGLWSGTPFEYHGRHFHIRETVFLPRPTQKPRIPIWVGGYWPNKAPFRRAARWDGIFPGRLTLERRQTWTPNMIPTDQLRSIREYITAHRTATSAFDVAIGGYSSGTDHEADRELVTAYRDAGATWWIENLHNYRGSFAEMRARLRLGPPAR